MLDPQSYCQADTQYRSGARKKPPRDVVLCESFHRSSPVADRQACAGAHCDESFHEMHTAPLLASESRDNGSHNRRRIAGDKDRLVFRIE